jgi:D-glycero-D-manno-heptose 1,7-bisphosphate phosphatase
MKIFNLANSLVKIQIFLMQAFFLDRDGVINHNYGYVYKPEEFDFVDGIFEVARHAIEKGFKLVVITNQAGIGRGYYSEREFQQLTDWMCEQFSQARAPIDRVYFSPYHPTAGLGEYLKDDFSRKPHPGMILQAQKDLMIDLCHSVLIGDNVSDILAGTAAGVGTNLLLASERPNELNSITYKRISTLKEAMPYLSGAGQ